MNRKTLIILVISIVMVLSAIFLIIYGFQTSQAEKHKVSVSIQLLYSANFSIYYPANGIRNYTLVFYKGNSSTIAATVNVHLYRVNLGNYHNYSSEQVNILLSTGDYTVKEFDANSGSFIKQFEIFIAKDTSLTISG
jgi:hypothetical protein